MEAQSGTCIRVHVSYDEKENEELNFHLKGTGSLLGVCALYKLLFSDLLVILLLIIPLTCISAITYYSKPKWNGGGLNSQEILVDYTNTANVKFIVDPKVLFHG